MDSETFEEYCMKYGIDEEYPMTPPIQIKAMREAEKKARAIDMKFPAIFHEYGVAFDQSEEIQLDNLRKHDRLGEFEDSAEAIYEDLLEVLISKQIDYGPDNINNAPGGAMNGILVRMSDKMERLKNLTYHTDEDAAPNHESIDDSLLDIANYAVIAMMVRQGSWPASLNA